jgi:phosphatidylinositol alpha-1,6-mannosyltransferase
VLLARDKARANVVKRTAMRMIYEGAAGIVANSAFTACLTSDAMAEARVTRAPPLAAIDLGTDPAHFHPGRDDGTLRKRFGFGDAPLMLTVARLVPHKGQDTAIAVLATLRDRLPALRYLVVGSGGDKARLARMAEQLGVSDRVVFAGQLSDDDIAQAYATATVYVGLSRVEREVNVEGFGISFVEAAASGTPSVAGDSGGVSAAVRDGEMGFLVPPTDVAVAANAVARLVASPELRAWMGDAARQAVETHYNWDRVARETAAFADTVSR